MENDYTLLRRFDLKQAQQGEGLCTAAGQPVKFIDYQAARPGYYQVICYLPAEGIRRCFSADGMFYDYPSEFDVFMAPLGWIEGRPVYKGDALFHKIQRGKYVIDGFDDSIEGGAYCSGILWLAPGGLTWDEPAVVPSKTLREGWVNIYPERRISRMYELEKDANRSSAGDRIACARIEWEEALK